jgi:hypothetical protein
VHHSLVVEGGLDQRPLPPVEISVGDAETVAEHLAEPLDDRTAPGERVGTAQNLSNQLDIVDDVHRLATHPDRGDRIAALQRKQELPRRSLHLQRVTEYG